MHGKWMVLQQASQERCLLSGETCCQGLERLETTTTRINEIRGVKTRHDGRRKSLGQVLFALSHL